MADGSVGVPWNVVQKLVDLSRRSLWSGGRVGLAEHDCENTERGGIARADCFGISLVPLYLSCAHRKAGKVVIVPPFAVKVFPDVTILPLA